MRDRDTIAATATGMTDSGIGIIRISGEKAVEVGNRMVRSPSGREILAGAQSHRMYYGFAVDTEKDFVIDEVMAVVMKAPKSFTGEDTVEIQCHGGVFVMRRILETALRCGARLAEPGEFTRRAYLGGRIDLSGAEAVMDVIHAQSETALAVSVRQLKGALAEEVRRLRGEILYEIAFIESALDDPEHISLEGYPEKLSAKIKILAGDIARLLDTADRGRFLREGISAVIVGKPNAGKSSFLNRLLGEERAIVTDVAGTTRDALQETVRIGDISLNVVDTAGIRDARDPVEKIGVARARGYAKDADLIVYVVDGSVELDENDREIAALTGEKRVIVLLNKSDLVSATGEEEILRMYGEILPGREKPLIIRTSMKEFFMKEASMKGASMKKASMKKASMKKASMKETSVEETSVKENLNSGLEEFSQAVKEMFFRGDIKSSSEIIITNLRHQEALRESLDSLTLVERSIEDGMPEDFYSIDLMNAYASLGRIIGEEVDDDLVEEIFSKFCMGK